VSESYKNSVESAYVGSRPENVGFCSRPMDRRHHKRYHLQATARFSWKDAGGARFEGSGLTRDISEKGVFVLTKHIPPSGTTVRLEVRAPSHSGSGLLIQSRGQVVRVEGAAQPPATLGFAAATRSLKLRDCNPAVISAGGQYKPVPEAPPAAWRSDTRKPN
jgi:PilZ domain